MKNLSSLWVLAFLLLPLLCWAQTATSVQTTVPWPTSYTVVSRDANSCDWAGTNYIQGGPNGQVIAKAHHYTELATGLNFRDPTGQWTPSKEEIDILPDGSAAATNGQHQAYFPADIYNGAIKLVTPDGLQLQSQPVGLSYDDGTQTVLIAELTNSIGQLVGPNQIIYTNAFIGIDADLLYTYTKAGFEQDVILDAQPPPPESYGLNPQTARLQLVTEFFNPPQPTVTTAQLPEQAGLALIDSTLDFGEMEMGRGRAFLLGTSAEGSQVMVGKQWLSVNGRHFLVEEVPVAAIGNQLSQLPTLQTSALKANSLLNVVSAKRLLPPPRFVKSTHPRPMQVARAGIPRRGFLLDYQTINGTLTNYTFQGDTTYYISGGLTLLGTNVTFEGGTVIKYSRGVGLSLSTSPVPAINWQASAYRPVIFTAMDDDSVGESISGSTGNPTNYYANPALEVPFITTNIANIRVAYAQLALYSYYGSLSISDAQFVDCQSGILAVQGPQQLNNALFANTATNFVSVVNPTFNVQNVTFSTSICLDLAPTYITSKCWLTNCILANVTSLTNGSVQLGGGYNGFYNAPSFGSAIITNQTYPFQAVGAGSYYLTNGCAFANVGTANIDPTLLADLATETTYPPFVYSNITLTTNLTLSPTVPRDNSGTPDLGYHYDVLDYAFGSVDTTNATITVIPGTAIGIFSPFSGYYGMGFNSGGQLNCQGLANDVIQMVEFNTVQEGTNWFEPTYAMMSSWFDPPQAAINAKFTHWSSMAQDVPIEQDEAGDVENYQNCEFYGGVFYSDSDGLANFTNCLFQRVNFQIFCTGAPTFQNNLFWNGKFIFEAATNALMDDNLFDHTAIMLHRGQTTQTSNAGYNAYVTNCNTLTPVNPSDVILSNSPAYETSWFGNFYLPTNSPILHKGSASANLLGLYHFTTQTNQIPEGTNIVTIGYHYVATDQYGNPLDSNGDGVPDYIEDANGDGLVDDGETNWALAILVQPTNQLAIRGTFTSFSVTADGVPPLAYQWYFNSNILANATNSTLTFNDVQTTNEGAYFVVVTNNYGAITSSVATLAVAPPLASGQIAAGIGFNVAVAVDGTVWTWGYNDDGELGDGSFTDSYTPVPAVGLSNIVTVASEEDAFFALALDSQGKVWSWGGGGYYGELGQSNGLDYSQNIAGQVWGLSNIVSITAEEQSGIALRSDGTVWAWGYDEYGELGDGTDINRDYAKPVIGLTNAIAIGAGDDHAFALCADGTVWGWGGNDRGQLGIGSNSVAQYAPVQVTALTNVVEIAGAYKSSIAARSDGMVMTWGDNYLGELGNGTNGNGTDSSVPIEVPGLSNIVAVAGGDNNFLAFNTNGNLFVWGFGGDGELGNGTENSTNVPIPVVGVSNVVAIAGGAASMLAMTANGKIYEWGQFLNTNYLFPFEVDLPTLPVDDASNVTAYFTDQYVNTRAATAYTAGGPALWMAVLVSSTNFASAQWTAFAATESVNLGTTDGVYQVWFGFRGQNRIPYWSMKTITLDTTAPVVNLTAPANNSSFNLSSINVQGNFVEVNFKQLQVNGVQAFISGTNFTALNVPLGPGTNVITAVAEDLAGNFGSNSIVAMGLTNADGSMNTPVQLQATPVAGFAPLTVSFQITSNAAPGTFQQVSYDFNGDGIADFVTNNLNPISYTYATNGEYFPVASIQTTAGTFSSSGGWNSTDPNRLQITVQLPVTQIASFSVTDPVDIKWVAPTNLYVLSGSTATLKEMDTNGNVVRSISNLGSNPSGFDVDTNGDVYVAVTSSNQVWKFDPTTNSFAPDTNFGLGGFIGLTNGLAGTTNGAFNAPFCVAVSPDNNQISVSDSGNNRIQQFDSNGNFQDSFGSSGSGIGQLNVPKGLTYDLDGSLYIVDSSNNRIVISEGAFVTSVTGTSGTAFGQFNEPFKINFGKHGVYIADTENSRIQSFNSPAPHIPFSADSSTIRFAVSTNLNQPSAVAAMDDDLTTEKFWVADTGNNRVALYALAKDDPTSAWTSMTNHIASGDISGALSYFSSASLDNYQQAFQSLGTDAVSDINQIGPLAPVSINDTTAEYYFEQTVGGQLLLFPVEFVKENGVWKILQF
jgi:alpha-tubulin suppressor-like RCC1 family protein